VFVTAVDPQAPVFAQVPVTADGVDGTHSSDTRPDSSPASFSEVVRAYVGLTKPRIVELLLLTTVPVMFLAEGGVPSLRLVVFTVVGGTMAAGSANALNCVFDRDIDEKMHRTRRRPLPRHQVTTTGALVFGLALGVAATLLLGFAVNWLSSALALAANAFYVLVYTLVLKRRTAQNIVWGGAAGCFPALIGWTAVTGSLAWAPVVLFLVVFFWTPPHFWSLAIRYRDDYAAASVPMLPVVASSYEVGRQIVVYAWLTVLTSLLLWPVADTGWVYPAAAAVLGVLFVAEAHALWRRARTTEDPVALKAMRLFHGSNAYLALLFLAVALDPLVTR
jgi:protoheme IX farnesyltransferase